MYLVRIKVYNTKEDYDKDNGKILMLKFSWKKMRKYKAFEPTPSSKHILNQFIAWQNLDIDKNTLELKI